ncbi:unnamed protein product [Durusdinium trenchii]|uniref:Sfi1 spindle body domain-containing protein n=1 Tax=Durusdinium trenchii TaxID=1381693 RepID=A0ABP0ITQ5_9DINO
MAEPVEDLLLVSQIRSLRCKNTHVQEQTTKMCSVLADWQSRQQLEVRKRLDCRRTIKVIEQFEHLSATKLAFAGWKQRLREQKRQDFLLMSKLPPESGLLIHAFLSWRCAATQARLASTRKERDEAFVLARRSHQACDAKLDAMRLRLLKERRSRRLADTRAALACLQVLASLGQLSFGLAPCATTPELAALCFCAWQLSVSQAAQGHALQNRIGEAGVRSFDEPKRHNLRMSVDQISRDHNAKWHLCRLSGMPSPAHLCFAVWRLWSSCRFRCEKLSGRITQRLQAGVKRLWLQRWQNALCQLRLFRSTSGAFLRRCFRYWADMARQTHWKRSGKLREPEERRAKETLCALLLLSFRGLHMNAQVQRAERECMTCDVDDRSTARQQAVKPTYATKAVGGEDDEGSQVELYGRKQTTVGFGMKPQPIARPSGFLLPDLLVRCASHLVAIRGVELFQGRKADAETGRRRTPERSSRRSAKKVVVSAKSNGLSRDMQRGSSRLLPARSGLSQLRASRKAAGSCNICWSHPWRQGQSQCKQRSRPFASGDQIHRFGGCLKPRWAFASSGLRLLRGPFGLFQSREKLGFWRFSSRFAASKPGAVALQCSHCGEPAPVSSSSVLSFPQSFLAECDGLQPRVFWLNSNLLIHSRLHSTCKTQTGQRPSMLEKVAALI